MGLKTLPLIKKYNIYSLTAAEWHERNERIEKPPWFQELVTQVRKGKNVTRQHQQLNNLLQHTFRDRYKQAGDAGDLGAEKVYERKHTGHEFFRNTKRYRKMEMMVCEYTSPTKCAGRTRKSS